MLSRELCVKFVKILEEELLPAMGCTEPIAIAFAAAKAREILGEEPISARLEVSGNIVKNTKSVVVPHTGGQRGLKIAFVAGLAAKNFNKELEVLSTLNESDIEIISELNERLPLEIAVSESENIFEIFITLRSKNHTAQLKIVDSHTNIILIKRDGEVLFTGTAQEKKQRSDRTALTVKNIIEFAESVDINEVKEILDRQISFNMAIAEEGLRGDYGANIGKVLLKSYQPDIKTTAKAYAAAGSDARMNGCELPVVINSGSGNQGITCSVPVIVYARGLHLSEEKLYRALCISNLITVHLKTGVGTLSAYCGAVSAGAGAGCGIAYLLGGGYEEISHTIVNALAIDSGIICDGAKASCAAKISTAVESGILGLNMFYNGNQFSAGDGIVKKGVENTIDSVSRLAFIGMRETDKEILKIMMEGN